MRLLKPWPDEFPSASIGELCEIRGGKPAPKDGFVAREHGEGVPFVRMRDLGRHHVARDLRDFSALIDPDFASAKGYEPLPVGSILMPRSGSVALNHRAILGIEAAIVSHICALIVRDASLCSPDYLFHVLCRMDMTKLSTKTTGLDAISFSSLRRVEIPLPPLAEQKRIAAILDAADALRAKRRESIAQLDALFQSAFLDTFGDPVVNAMGWAACDLSSAFWFQEGPGVRKWQFRDSGIKLLNVSNILKTGELDLSRTDRHLEASEVERRYSRFLADDGDLVIASSGVSIDDDGLLRTRAAFVRAEHLPLCMNTSTIRFKAIDGVSHLTFLKQWINGYEFRKQITQEVTGSAQKNFGPTHLKRLKVTLPPLDLQEEFARKVDAIEQQRLIYRTHLAELDSFFQAVQSAAFSGEL